MNLEMYSGDMTIKLEVNPGPEYAGDAYGPDLLTQAIVSLIENFDPDFAQDDEVYWDSGPFYAAILSAVARHSMVDTLNELDTIKEFVDDADDITTSVYEVLVDLLEYLSSDGLLQETITSEVDEYDG